MKIGLIDCDHKNGNTFPNLALMKISAYGKRIGNDVDWYMPFGEKYDVVYMSKVFSFTPDYQDVINTRLLICGGTGFHIELKNGKEVYNKYDDTRYDYSHEYNTVFWDTLPDRMEHLYPDYSIYGITDTAYGFLTRGCPRACDFCHVAAKEGKRSHKVADLNEFWNGQKNIVLLDPNILACGERTELLQQLIDSKAYVDFSQGLDARMLNEDICEMISRIKIKDIHFAWDRYEDKESVLRGLELYAKYAKRKPHAHNSIVYTIVNFDTTFEQDLERIYTLRDLGYWAYVMIYDKEHAHPEYKHLQRWCNNRKIFASCPRYEDYLI